MMQESYFDGSLLQLVLWKLLGAILTVISFGILYPFAFCLVYRWEAKHTVISGKRMKFDGTAMQLFGKWIIWYLLTFITLGIYAFWLGIKMKKWKTKHTIFDETVPADAPHTENPRYKTTDNTDTSEGINYIGYVFVIIAVLLLGLSIRLISTESNVLIGMLFAVLFGVCGWKATCMLFK